MADTSTSTPAHLPPSALGTKEYWDSLYEKELANHAENPADEGTVWFDDSDAEAKIVEFLTADDPASTSAPAVVAAIAAAAAGGGGAASEGGEGKGADVLDLGCGNGSLLFALRDAGWRRGRLLGVDYSERSVRLARSVGRARRERRKRRTGERAVSGEDDGDGDGDGDGEDGEQDQDQGQDQNQERENDTGVEDAEENQQDEGEYEVEFQVWDVLRGDINDVRARPASQSQSQSQSQSPSDAGWDVVLDKGTFDAVSLSAERDGQGRRLCEGYGERVLALLRRGGIFVVTSCNWTEKELREWFEGAGAGTETETKTRQTTGRARLRLVGRIEYPSFSFGGVKGQTISTLCFEKVVA